MKMLALVLASIAVSPFLVVGLLVMAPALVVIKMFSGPVADDVLRSLSEADETNRWCYSEMLPEPIEFKDEALVPWTKEEALQVMIPKLTSVCLKEKPDRKLKLWEVVSDNRARLSTGNAQDTWLLCNAAKYSNDDGKTWLPCGKPA